MKIVKAEIEDLAQLLEVQYAAYEFQAVLNNDFTIPPMTETLVEVTRDFPGYVVLKAVTDDGALVGSVRGRREGDTCLVGRLFVQPGFQGQGIGTALLYAIEKACPAPRYELFTSSKSIDNIRLYEKTGYVLFKEEYYSPEYNLVYMEKLSGA